VSAASLLADKYQIPNDFGVKACLTWPSVWQQNDLALETIASQAILAFEEAIAQLSRMREQEGQAILSLIEEKRLKILSHLQLISEHQSRYPILAKEKIKAKVALLTDVSFDRQRLEQELVLMLMRNDIAEEIDRLQTHLFELEKILYQKDALGRRLDFLIQELRRTAFTSLNTPEISALVILNGEFNPEAGEINKDGNLNRKQVLRNLGIDND
jgi:uncharacterized protein (TIGR00255 family)